MRHEHYSSDKYKGTNRFEFDFFIHYTYVYNFVGILYNNEYLF